MFWADQLFTKKGGLARLWLAGTAFSKLNKNAILSMKVDELCKTIESPPVPLALRTQATLVHGIVRVHNKKAVYLLGDAMDARTKLSLIKDKKATTTSTMARFDQVTVAPPRDTGLPPLDQQQYMALDDFMLDMSALEGQAWSVIDVTRGDEASAAKRQKLMTAREEDITLSSNSGWSQSQMQGIDFAAGDVDISSFSLDQSTDLEGLDWNVELPRRSDSLRASFGGLDSSSFALQLAEDSQLAEPPSPMLGMDIELPDLSSSSAAEAVPSERKRVSRKRKREEREDRETAISDSAFREGLNNRAATMTSRPNVERPTASVVQNHLQRLGFVPSPGNQHVAHQLADALHERLERNKESELRAAEGVDERFQQLVTEVSGVEAARAAISDMELPEMGSMAEPLSDLEAPAEDDMMRSEVFNEPALPFEEEEEVAPISQMQQEMSQAGIAAAEGEGFEEFQRQYSAVTKIFKRILYKAWKVQGEDVSDFAEALHGYSDRIYRHDAAVSFQQLLLLRTMDEVKVTQDEAYGPISVQKGPQWHSLQQSVVA